MTAFHDLFSFKTENNMKLIDYVGRVDIPKSREMIKVLSDSGKCVRPQDSTSDFVSWKNFNIQQINELQKQQQKQTRNCFVII